MPIVSMLSLCVCVSLSAFLLEHTVVVQNLTTHAIIAT